MDDQPFSYDKSRLVFRTDHAGNDLVIRPGQVIANPAATGVPIEVAVAQVQAEVAGRRWNGKTDRARVEALREVRGDWQLFAVPPELDVIRLVRGLRDRGIPAQPNHVYFVTTQPRHRTSGFDPNLFAPNLFAPNLFAPNLFAPNLFAPNLFAPNLFAPNLFAPHLSSCGSGAGGSGCGCCCPGGLSQGEDRAVPRLAARPVEKPRRAWPTTVDPAEARVEIHVIDIATPGPGRPPENQTGELTDPGHLHGDAIDENGDGWADPAMGHGDFVRSIVELNSGLRATLWQAADPLGDIDDADLVAALVEVDRAASAGPRILNLSLSGYNEDDRPSVVLADQVAQMLEGSGGEDGWLIVASAGNNASCRLAWPAALPGVVAVGAIGPCGPAWFSNHGAWVDASAVGIDVVARYPDLTGADELKVDTDDEGHLITTHDFGADGWASWSGTSFSAPLVTARLAQRLQEGSSVRQAIDAVITDETLPRLPRYGTLVP